MIIFLCRFFKYQISPGVSYRKNNTNICRMNKKYSKPGLKYKKRESDYRRYGNALLKLAQQFGWMKRLKQQNNQTGAEAPIWSSGNLPRKIS